MGKYFKRPYLIQRLNKPYNVEGPLSALAGAFSFGGGLVNGGLSKEAMGLLNPLMSFDYMGSAEFEWGAVPKAFEKIAENIKNTIAWTIEINKVKVYVIGDKELKEEINNTLEELSNNKLHLKEHSSFDLAIGKGESYDYYKEKDIDYECRTQGWLELDNGFMFFVSEEMFTGVSKLFGLTLEA